MKSKKFYLNGDATILAIFEMTPEELLLENLAMVVPCFIEVTPIEMNWRSVKVTYREEDEDYVNDFIAYYGWEA